MNVSENYDHSRIFNGDIFAGTYVAYAATPWGDITPFACDAKIHSLDESRPDEFRAYRKATEKRGSKPGPSRASAFQQEICVIFGPRLSAKQAIAALERMVENIKSKGLLIGRAEAEGDYHVEQVDGTISPPLPRRS